MGPAVTQAPWLRRLQPGWPSAPNALSPRERGLAVPLPAPRVVQLFPTRGPRALAGPGRGLGDQGQWRGPADSGPARRSRPHRRPLPAGPRTHRSQRTHPHRGACGAALAPEVWRWFLKEQTLLQCSLAEPQRLPAQHDARSARRGTYLEREHLVRGGVHDVTDLEEDGDTTCLARPPRRRRRAGRAGPPDSQSRFLPRRSEGRWPGPSGRQGASCGESRASGRAAVQGSGCPCIPFPELRGGGKLAGRAPGDSEEAG